MVKYRIDKLVNIINEADYNYHTLDNPVMSDQEYDQLLRELIELEENNPDLIREDSPTRHAGGEIISSFDKVEHTIPMMSLADAFSYDELISFDERVKKEVGDVEYVCELKIDGLSVSLIYENSKLIKAATRGNGIVGEDVTHNVKTIKSIPLYLKKEGVDIVVRGEIYMNKSTLEKLNKEREKENLPLLQNCRNAAAGSIRQLDSTIASKRKLDSFIYHIPEMNLYNINKQYDCFKYLSDLGFKVNTNNKVLKNIDEVIEYIEYLSKIRDDLKYDIDGVVVKVNDVNKQKKLGVTAKYPKWAIAYKFPALVVLTTLEDIIFTVGRTGKITPNAVLSKTLVQGSTISRATLHNEEYIKERNLKIGDIVSIRKAGDVIPEVIEAIFDRRNGDEKDFVMISNCPICNSILIKKGGVDYYCNNELCSARNAQKLIHFTSRAAMNINGLGEEIIEDLYNFKFIKDISDIYLLKNHINELIQLEGYGKKSIDNLLKAIEDSKSNSLEKLIFALGITHVGEKTSKILANFYKTIDNLINSSYDELITLDDIGEKIALSIINYFKEEENINIINKLKEYGVNMTNLNKIDSSNEIISNNTFVITGTLSVSRDYIKELIESKNGKVSSSVSKMTRALIVGDNPGSKFDKAKSLGVEIWDEDKIMGILQNN